MLVDIGWKLGEAILGVRAIEEADVIAHCGTWRHTTGQGIIYSNGECSRKSPVSDLQCQGLEEERVIVIVEEQEDEMGSTPRYASYR